MRDSFPRGAELDAHVPLDAGLMQQLKALLNQNLYELVRKCCLCNHYSPAAEPLKPPQTICPHVYGRHS